MRNAHFICVTNSSYTSKLRNKITLYSPVLIVAYEFTGTATAYINKEKQKKKNIHHRALVRESTSDQLIPIIKSQ